MHLDERLTTAFPSSFRPVAVAPTVGIMTQRAPFARERAFAEAAVLRATIITKEVQYSVKGVSKEDASPVTAADFAAQALLIAALCDAFPDDNFVGEEDSEVLRNDPQLATSVFELVRSAEKVKNPETGDYLPVPSSEDEMLALIDRGGRGKGGPTGRFWVMDPVDGTKTFLSGQQYAISLSLIENGREMVGILCCPNLKLCNGRVVEDSVDKVDFGILLSAVRGQGASSRLLSGTAASLAASLPASQPLARLEAPSDLTKLHIVNSRKSTAIRHDIIEELATQIGASYPGTEVWSSHMRYASLILGGADCQIRVPVHAGSKVCIWDHAGAQLIFTEIGGKITDLDGKPMDFGAGREMFNNRGMLVAREGVHGDVLNLVRAILGS